ncbi:energy-coupling factor ABC transporter ATP-binding protein [Bacillus sp. FJAT-47783]|uniref:energy-coupling factor ABC transporter ATP-binding protein n=1 Tax=Bacillus sp. FJAT-47783 TaxID=2922712 RepID=UPI001FAC3FB7|nr:energy-coupling factor ABC transporter ATP-binding protein [Bacillus sp. FJAT-47783]
MGQPVIQVKDVTFRYRSDQKERAALQQVSMCAHKGEWLAIVGHNGSGKSTLARLLNGLLLPEEGTIHVLGTPLNEHTVWEIRKHVGMVFQNPDNQFVGTTVRDDVAFGLENLGVPREEMLKRIKWAIEKVNMSNFLDYEPHHLSGGQKQRVAIASVLAVQPKIIILDEATSMLDPIGRNDVLKTVRELKKQGQITVISITHDLEEAALADRIIVMNDGFKYAEGTPHEIFQLDEKLNEIGLDLPFSFKLSKKLKQLGISLQQHHLTEESLVDELCTLTFKT